jgi:hypothetical protein
MMGFLRALLGHPAALVPVEEAISMASKAYEGVKAKHPEFSERDLHTVTWGIVMRNLGMPVPPGQLTSLGFQETEFVDCLPHKEAMEGIGLVVMQRGKHQDLDPGKPWYLRLQELRKPWVEKYGENG